MVFPNFTYISSFGPLKSHFRGLITKNRKKISKICRQEFSYIVEKNLENEKNLTTTDRRLTYMYRLKHI